MVSPSIEFEVHKDQFYCCASFMLYLFTLFYNEAQFVLCLNKYYVGVD